MCLVLTCKETVTVCSPSNVQRGLSILQQVQDEVTGEDWLRMSWMALGWLVVGQSQKYFLSFFLGSFEFAPGRESGVLRTKRLCNLCFSPPATHPLTLHICSARGRLPPLIGNNLSTKQPSDFLPVNKLLKLGQSNLKRQQS